jgi:hypothetical protein
MRKVVDLNFISFIIQESRGEQIVFEEKEMIQAKWQGLRWYNDTWLDKGDVV